MSLDAGRRRPTSVDRDDSLALLLCCHPALTGPSQVALTLRAVAGLSTAQMARGFLVPEATMAQRISRAKARLRQVGRPVRRTAAGQLPDRVAAVAHVLYLVFTEGHTATTGAGLSDVSLAGEADPPGPPAARAAPRRRGGWRAAGPDAAHRRATPARPETDGSLVPLADQDRTRWDQRLIAEGVALVERALPSGPVGPYQLQAAIAAVHAEAPTPQRRRLGADPDALPDAAAVAPGPVVTLNRAVAVADDRRPGRGAGDGRAAARRPAAAPQPPAARGARAPARDGRSTRTRRGRSTPSPPAWRPASPSSATSTPRRPAGPGFRSGATRSKVWPQTIAAA